MATIIETTDAAAGITTIYEMAVGDVFTGSLRRMTSDWIKVTVDAPGTYSLTILGLGPQNTGLTDPMLILHDARGNTLLLDDDSGPGFFPGMTLTTRNPGTWYVEIASPNPYPAGDYALVVSAGDKPSLSIDLGAAVLYRPGVSWAEAPGQATTVTWGVRSEGLTTDAQGNAAPFFQLTAAQIEAAKIALANYSDIANLTFTQLNPGGNSNDATILMGAYSSDVDGAGAYAFYPGDSSGPAVEGDLWLNNTAVSRDELPFGSYSYFVMLHELGHALGLDHPGDYNAAPGVEITYENSAQFVQDSRQYTVMSYFAATETEADAPTSYPDTLLLHDIRAIQQMYGVNLATRAGDDTYGFNSTLGGAYDFTTNTDPMLCIWDGGGIDTLDLSGFGKGQRIDLREGAFSDVAQFKGNLSIALGAVIENAVGGARSDDITGNAADNRLQGGKGNDTLTGGAGDDLLIGNRGADSFAFAAGMGTGRVRDFDIDRDQLLLNASLWDGASLTAEDVLSTYGRARADAFVLDFGAARIILSGLTADAGLVDALVLV